MPAETHQHVDRLDEEDVLAVVAASLGLDDLPSVDAGLADLGVDGDVALLDLWSDLAAELGERTLSVADVDPADVVTVGDLVSMWCSEVQPDR